MATPSHIVICPMIVLHSVGKIMTLMPSGKKVGRVVTHAFNSIGIGTCQSSSHLVIMILIISKVTSSQCKSRRRNCCQKLRGMKSMLEQMIFAKDSSGFILTLLLVS